MTEDVGWVQRRAGPDRTLDAGVTEVDLVVVPKDATQGLLC